MTAILQRLLTFHLDGCVIGISNSISTSPGVCKGGGGGGESGVELLSDKDELDISSSPKLFSFISTSPGNWKAVNNPLLSQMAQKKFGI